MCLFTGPVEDVSRTKIFGRLEGGRQYIVYEMKFSASSDVAMVLPIPVVPGSSEQAVEFISLESYTKFFADLDALFPVEYALAGDLEMPAALSEPVQTLQVHEVGAFEASFVPAIRDFVRLDERFRLPAQVWSEVGGYGDFGFAVFKLGAGNAQAVHPMAFSFPTRNPDSVFFPTVHVHDGEVHSEARFDHTLYCQSGAATDWEKSEWVASREVNLSKAQNIVSGSERCFRRRLWGLRDNVDFYLAA
jgi:hypothetical protein